MDLTAITLPLSERRTAQLTKAVSDLQTAIASGVVPNALYIDAKDSINRAVNDAYDAYQEVSRDFDGKLIMSAHDVISGVKQAAKANRPLRLKTLQNLLPLAELLAAAKPLIAKRGDNRLPPKPKTAEQIEREGKAMTCQCCGRGILANLGTIAHHGYERPGHGWQTGSCVGAKELPFEVSRERLGVMINNWRQRRKDMRNSLSHVVNETAEIELTIEDITKPRDKYGRHPTTTVWVSRETFDKVRSGHKGQFASKGYNSFDTVKEDDIAYRKGNIANITQAINEQQKRFDGWKQTHKGFENGAWVAL